MGKENYSKALRATRDPRVLSRLISGGSLVIVSLIALAFSHILLSRFGLEFFLITLVGLVFGSIFVVISFKSLNVPFILLVLSIGGFRYLWAIQAPVLPDLYLDRMALIWITMVFMIKLFAEGALPQKPWRLDLLILAHGTYVAGRVIFGPAPEHYFHIWTMSILMPYAVFFYAKNIVRTEKDIRKLLGFLLILSLYYNITAIAEKFNISWLLWPRYMVEEHQEFVGRSNGPFRNSGIFGNAIGMLLPIYLYFYSTVKNVLYKVLFLIGLVMGFAGLYFSYTRGSWLAGLAGLGVVALMNPRKYLKVLIPLVFLASFGAVLFLGIGQDKFMKERVENNNTIGSRVATEITLLRVWRDYPIFGCGSFAYGRVRGDYIEPISVPFLGTITFNQFRNNPAHDMYLGPLAEDGLFGMGLQVAIYVIIIRTLMRKFRWRRRNNHFALLIIPIFAGIAANYLFGALTISYRYSSILGTMFYLAAGIVDGYEMEEEN